MVRGSSSAKASGVAKMYKNRNKETIKQSSKVDLIKDPIMCPLCVELMDETDLSFLPCRCGYQLCLFCYNRVKEFNNAQCPGCRRPYGDASSTSFSLLSGSLSSESSSSAESVMDAPRAISSTAAKEPFLTKLSSSTQNTPDILQSRKRTEGASSTSGSCWSSLSSESPSALLPTDDIMWPTLSSTVAQALASKCPNDPERAQRSILPSTCSMDLLDRMPSSSSLECSHDPNIYWNRPVLLAEDQLLSRRTNAIAAASSQSLQGGYTQLTTVVEGSRHALCVTSSAPSSSQGIQQPQLFSDEKENQGVPFKNRPMDKAKSVWIDCQARTKSTCSSALNNLENPVVSGPPKIKCHPISPPSSLHKQSSSMKEERQVDNENLNGNSSSVWNSSVLLGVDLNRSFSSSHASLRNSVVQNPISQLALCLHGGSYHQDFRPSFISATVKHPPPGFSPLAGTNRTKEHMVQRSVIKASSLWDIDSRFMDSRIRVYRA